MASRRYCGLLSAALANLALLSSFPAEGDALRVSQALRGELTVPGLPHSAEFGASVSLSADGDVALVGVGGVKSCPEDPNRICPDVYVLTRDESGEWSLDARLTSLDVAHAFGVRTALSPQGNVALVSDTTMPCPDSNLPCGAVYVFARHGGSWVQEAKLFPPGVAHYFESYAFGSSLDLSADGSIALIGRPRESCTPLPCRGAVYVYVRGAGGSWVLRDHLTSSDSGVENFGISVALSWDGATALIGASNSTCGAITFCGAAYVFQWSGGGWSEPVKLSASDAAEWSLFGSSVDLSADGTVAAVARPYFARPFPPGTKQSAIYFFLQQGGSWMEQQKLSAGAIGDGVGSVLSLAPEGRIVFAGAPAAPCLTGYFCGAVYWSKLRNGVWTSLTPLMEFSASENGGASMALSADGSTALVGAPRANGSSCGFGPCGAVYVFELVPESLDIPAAGGAGLILLALLLAASGTFVLARKRLGLR